MEENKENPLKGRGPSDLLPEKGNPFSKRTRTKTPASEAPSVAPTATVEDDLPEMTADDVEMLFGDGDDEYFEMLAPIDLTPADLDVYFGQDDDDNTPDFVASDPDTPQEMTPEAVEAFFAEQEFEPDLATDLLKTPVDLNPEQLAALFDDADPQGDIMTNDENTPDLTPDMVESIFGNDPAEDAPEGMVAIESPMTADAVDPTGYNPAGMIDDIPADIPADDLVFGRPPIDAPVDLPGTSPSLPRMDAFDFDDTAASSEDSTPTGQLPPRGLPTAEDEHQFGSGPSTSGFEQTFDTPTFGTFTGSLPTAGERLAGSGGPETPSLAPRVNTYEVITPDHRESHADRPTSTRETTGATTLLLGPGTMGNFNMPPAVVELPEMLDLLVTEERIEELWERIDRVEERVIEEMAPTMPNRDLYLDRLRSARNLLLGGKAYYDDARRQLSDVENRVAFIPRMQSWSQTVATRLFFFQLICLLLLVIFASVIPLISPYLTFADMTETFIRILLWTISAGGAGGVLASLWSLRVHVTEKQDFDRQHELWYILTPVKGMLLGLFVFLASASNLVVPFQEGNVPSRFLVIAVALALGFQQNVAFDLIARVISVLKPEK